MDAHKPTRNTYESDMLYIDRIRIRCSDYGFLLTQCKKAEVVDSRKLSDQTYQSGTLEEVSCRKRLEVSQVLEIKV